MPATIVNLADCRSDSEGSLAQLLADAIAAGKVTLIVGEPGDRHGVQQATFSRAGDFWTFAYQGRVIRVVDGKGARYLATLLENPGVEFHALDLVAAEHDDWAAAKCACGARLDALRDELGEAEAFNDVERAALLREEIESLAHDLARAVGLDDTDRAACSPAERARVNVTRALRTLFKRIAAYDPVLGEELRATIRTGTFCACEPALRNPLTWRVERGHAAGRPPVRRAR